MRGVYSPKAGYKPFAHGASVVGLSDGTRAELKRAVETCYFNNVVEADPIRRAVAHPETLCKKRLPPENKSNIIVDTSALVHAKDCLRVLWRASRHSDGYGNVILLN